MKKMKKLMAALLAMVMMLAMTTTAFAATGTATITVEKADNAELSYVQIIGEDRTVKTGWNFTSEEVLKAFQSVPEYRGMSAQDIIQNLIDEGTTDAYKLALSNVAASEDVVYAPMSNPQEVTSAGVYSIKATETGFTYNNMAAYVGFGEDHPNIEDVKIEAKKQSTEVTKTEDDADNVVAIGDIVTYTIETVVPSINPNASNKTFQITDTINGAEYYLTAEDAKASVEMVAGTENTVVGGAERFEAKDNTFTIDLSDLINDTNSNAGKKIVVTYTAKVTDVTVDNTAFGHVGGQEVDSDTTGLYTAEIKVVKKDANDESKLLAGAGFKLQNADGKWATFDRNNKLTGWVDKKEDGTEVFTEGPKGERGTLTLRGLNVGKYTLVETTAPEGYSITEPEEVEIKKDGEATEIITLSQDVLDTKLASLPGTGGIGTTIFTIGGCIIMIAAAGFYFLSRKKENN